MAYWIMKSEPDAFSWEDMVRDGRAEWDGVRSAQASSNLKAMIPGDEALFYHSNIGLEAVGVMRVTRAWRPEGPEGRWASVELKPVRPLPKPVTLKAMKAEPRLAEMKTVRQSRLSVAPVSDAEWGVLLEMAGD